MKPPRLHVFVLIDALGWRFVEGRRFLDDLLPHRQPLPTVLGYSSGAIPTLLTGKRPAEHGHWNLFYYDPVGSPFRWLRFLRFLPERALDNRLTRRLLTEIGRRLLGLGPLFECAVKPSLLSSFNFIEKRNIYARDGIPGTASFFDRLAERAVPHRVYTYHTLNDAEILDRARRDIAQGEAATFFLYLSQIDAFLHRHCHDAAAVGRTLDEYARALRGVFEAARERDPQACCAIFSDHGMTPVSNHLDLAGRLAGLGLRMPDDYLAVCDSTMARFWFFRDEARRAVRECLDGIASGRTLSDAELDALGILFPDRRYGELVFLLDPGWLISSSDFNNGWKPRGMHGYHPDDPHSDGVFLASERPASPIRDVADVYGFLARALEP